MLGLFCATALIFCSALAARAENHRPPPVRAALEDGPGVAYVALAESHTDDAAGRTAEHAPGIERSLRSAGGESRATPLQVVPRIDFPRYAGRWYEIARLPNRFQRDCAADTSATYTLLRDGKIQVLNECRTASGRVKSAKGTAKVADAKGPNTKLKVTFFWPFSGDYWIIALEPNYRWALIGEPDRKYLWILSREPKMSADVYDGVIETARRQGYDTSRVLRTPQGAPVR